MFQTTNQITKDINAKQKPKTRMLHFIYSIFTSDFQLSQVSIFSGVADKPPKKWTCRILLVHLLGCYSKGEKKKKNVRKSVSDGAAAPHCWYILGTPNIPTIEDWIEVVTSAIPQEEQIEHRKHTIVDWSISHLLGHLKFSSWAPWPASPLRSQGLVPGGAIP